MPLFTTRKTVLNLMINYGCLEKDAGTVSGDEFALKKNGVEVLRKSIVMGFSLNQLLEMQVMVIIYKYFSTAPNLTSGNELGYDHRDSIRLVGSKKKSRTINMWRYERVSSFNRNC